MIDSEKKGIIDYYIQLDGNQFSLIVLHLNTNW